MYDNGLTAQIEKNKHDRMITKAAHEANMKRLRRAKNPNMNIHVKINSKVRSMRENKIMFSWYGDSVEQGIEETRQRMIVCREIIKDPVTHMDRILAQRDLREEQQLMIDLVNERIAWKVAKS